MPVRSALALTAALFLACAGRPSSRVEGSARAVRSRSGVCAARTIVSPSGSERRVRLEGCLRAGAPGTRFDNGDPRLITVLQAEDEPDAFLEEWQVLVLRDDERVLTRALDAGPPHRRCGLFRLRCRYRVADVAPMPAGLAPGTYTLRYRVISEDSYAEELEPAELTIVLR